MGDVGRAKDTIPRAEGSLTPTSFAILEEDREVSLENEEYLLYFMSVGRVALPHGNIHDAQGKVDRGNRAGILLARRATADKAHLSPAIARHSGIGKGIPVGNSGAERGDVTPHHLLQRVRWMICHVSSLE
jgi:hypothetical protein